MSQSERRECDSGCRCMLGRGGVDGTGTQEPRSVVVLPVALQT